MCSLYLYTYIPTSVWCRQRAAELAPKANRIETDQRQLWQCNTLILITICCALAKGKPEIPNYNTYIPNICIHTGKLLAIEGNSLRT